MPPPTPTAKDRRFLACRTKRCCRAGAVTLTDRDLVELCGRLGIAADAFVRAVPAAAPRPDAFALDDGPERYLLVLGKFAPREGEALGRCVFLLGTEGGHHRCGVGDGRPLTCRAFPSVEAGGVVLPDDGGLCDCGGWSPADLDPAEERAVLEELGAARLAYAARVAEWNAGVARRGTRASVADFLAWLGVPAVTPAPSA